MDSSEQRKRIDSTLNQWYKVALDKEDNTRDETESRFFSEYRSLISQALRELRKDSLAAVIDADKTIQAISFSYPDTLYENAWFVELVITAPHNFIKRHPLQVKGAGSALIEDAVLKSLKRQGLSLASPLRLEAMKKTAVTLQWAAGSSQFYRILFFMQDKPRDLQPHYLVLKGENLVRFLENYGGRASFCTPKEIE